MMNEKEVITETKSLGYKVGYIIGSTIGACVTVILIALTVKFIMWLF